MKEDACTYIVEREYLSKITALELVKRIVRNHLETVEINCKSTSENIVENR